MKFFKKISPLLSFFGVLLIFAVIFKFNDIYPLGSKTISWCDMDQQTIPLLCAFKDVLSGKSDLWLSLENAGGMNFFGVYFFNLSSPFTYLVLFFEKSAMPLAVNVMVVLKLAFSALTFSLWLNYFVKNANPIAVVALSVLYAFSGYAMMYYQILSWLDTYYVFPLLLMGLTKMAEGKSPALYIVSLFSCILFHFYLGWAVVIFVCLFGAVFALTHAKKDDGFAKNFILSSVVSALLSMLVIVPAFLQYTQSMRQGSIIDALKQTNPFPPTDTSLPTFFCLLIVAPFIANVCRKKGTDYLEILFILLLVPVILEPVSAGWQTYDYMSFPTRYGFITIALGLTLALRGLTEITEENEEKSVNKKGWIKVIGSVVAVAFAVAFCSFSHEYYEKTKEVITAYSQSLWGNRESFVKLITYYLLPLCFTILVYFAIRFKLIHKIAVYALIAILCVTEAGFSANVYMTAPANDYSYFNKAMELNEVIEDDDFYRVKTDGKYFHVNMVGAMGYNSISHYTSLNRESFMMAVKQLGYSSYWMETHSNGGTIFTDALLRHKYAVTNASVSNPVYQTESFKVYQNEILFPTAFLISEQGQNSANLSLERWQIQNELFTRLTGKSGLYEEYAPTTFNGVKDESTQEKSVYVLEEGKPAPYITYVINVSGEKAIYFDCFDMYSNSLREHTYDTVSYVTLQKNYSTVARKYNYPSQSTNGVLYLGTYKNCEVTVKVALKRQVDAKSFGVFSVDKNVLQSAVNELIGGDFTVVKDELTGEITAKSGDALFTSFAYDEGYRAKVNGKRAKTFEVNGFLAIKLEEGVNEVAVDFIPRGLYLGIALFIFGAILFACYFVFYKKIQALTKYDKLLTYAVIALGGLVIMAIYVFPTFISLLP